MVSPVSTQGLPCNVIFIGLKITLDILERTLLAIVFNSSVPDEYVRKLP